MSDEVKSSALLPSLHRSSFRLQRWMRVAAVKRRLQRSISSRLAVAVVLALSCLLFSLIHSSAQNSNETPDPRAANLHQWGAVTLFHGLPSDRVRAIEQDAEGALWFGTDGGLARYDGRRTQTVAVEGLAQGRVNALKFDESGTLWVGTDAGAAVMREGVSHALEETKGKEITAIISQGRGRAVMTTTTGQLYSCAINLDGTVSARAFPAEPLRSADADKPGALPLMSLAQGRNGVIYVGTRSRGLLAFDGERAREVLSRPRPFFVEALDADARGGLWVGALARGADGGLYAGVDPMRANERAQLKRVGEVSTVDAVRRDAAGDVWTATDGLGAFRFHDAQQAEHFTFENTAGGLRSNRVFSIFFDREGVVWFGTDRGVCRYDPSAPRTETFGGDMAGNFVRALYRTKKGELLVGTSRGLFIFDDKRNVWSAVAELSRRAIYSIAEDARGRLLVGTSIGLFAKVETSGRKKDDEERRSDGQKNGDQRTGDQSGDDQKDDQQSQQKRNVGESVRAIRQFRGGVYVASYGRGVERVEGERRTLVFPASGADARLREVTSLYAEGDARLWIGTARAGAFVFENDRARALDADGFEKLRAGAVWAFDGTVERGLWIGAEKGLYFYRAGMAVASVAPNIDARAVVASAGDLARGAADAQPQGGSAASRQGGKVAPQPSREAAVRQMSEATAQPGMEVVPPTAWCATAGGGLLRVRLDPEFGALVSRLDVEQGLASSYAFALMRVDDDERASSKDAAHQETTSEDGALSNLQSDASSNAPSGVAAETLLVGTTRGLVRYRPSAVLPSLVAVRVLSRRLHSMQELESGISLPYPQNSLALDVAAQSSRTFPEQFIYAFTLRDAAGREVKRKLGADAQFLMENLPHGSYTVEARAFTKDLVASAPLRFTFTVGRAPFPRTTVLLASLLALAVVALGWGAWQNRKMARATGELADANRQLASARLNLANEAERERRRIARDLHDQTLADLRSLMLLTDQLPARVNGQRDAVDPTTFRAEIESISTEIRRICEDLSPSALDNVGLAAALEWSLSNAAAHCPAPARFEHEFSADEDLDERLSLAPGVRMQIYRIAQEAITNVCRHAAARRVSLSVSLSRAGELLLTLEDDGRADFDPQDRRTRRGRGLTSIRDRASLIEADVSWESREAGGTRFTLRKADAAKISEAV
jgi:signal transduction histidine kinase/ligand-binding sensor domain-containing protein